MKFKSNKTVKLLIKKKKSLSIAESCTGGMLSSSITSVAGSSKVFKLGLITYSNYSKINLLKVPKKVIQNHGAVSIECCRSMVQNLSKIAKTDISISITGIAGPKGGTKFKPVGLVYIGIKKGNKIVTNRYLFKKKDRSKIQKKTVKKALELILRILK